MAQAVDTARVLIVDDNMNALRALEYVLDRAGFDVDCAASGSVALDRLRKSSYDVVVSDLKMPGMTGMELLSSIQTFRPGLPVLILTAHGTIDNAVEAVRHGAVDYLQKPFPTSDIAGKVRAALEQHVAEATASPAEDDEAQQTASLAINQAIAQELHATLLAEAYRLRGSIRQTLNDEGAAADFAEAKRLDPSFGH